MALVNKTENEIIGLLQAAANEKGINLTYTHKLFFIKLLGYAQKYGEHCPEGIMVRVSGQDLAKYLSISRRMVAQSLNAFVSCDVILRREGEKTFPRSTNATIIRKEYYE